MAEHPVHQRLAAILFADVAGYAELMDKDEAGTYAAWRDARAAVVEPVIGQHKGRVVKFTGDGFLAEFSTAESALSCAVKMQEGFVGRDPLRLRIGVHLGDVYFENDDVYGDGVNVAARLEGLAEPGGICISGTVHDLVRKKLPLDFEDGGRQALKHIAEPIQVWRIAPRGGAVGRKASMPASIPRLPGIAVLPFVNMSGDIEQEYFADGLTEDLITELARTGALFVIARNSTFVYKGRAVNVPTVARELGVRYLLEGSVRKAAQRIRVTAQLIDGESGGHLWAERYDRDVSDVFAVQDEITRSIVGALALNLRRGPHHRAIEKGTDNIEAYDLFLKGRELAWQMTKSCNEQARPLLERAISLDPGFARAYAILAHVRLASWLNRWSAAPDTDAKEAIALAETAIRLNPFEPSGYWIVASWHLWRREFEVALAMVNRALAVDPAYFTAHSTLGGVLLGLNRPQEALEAFEVLTRVDPLAPTIMLHYRARALFLLGRYEGAVELLKERITRTPETDVSRALLASAYGHLGRFAEAREAWEGLFKVNPTYSLAQRRSMLADHEYVQLAAGLERAGLVERGT